MEDDSSPVAHMKILVFSSYFLPHRGGVENYVYQTSKRLVKRGHKVTVVTSRLKGMKDREIIDGINVLRLPAADILPDRFPLVLPFFPLESFDVIVTHTRFYPLSFAGGLYAKARGIPWIHIEHGTKQVDYDNLFVRSAAKAVDSSMGKWILKNARVAAVSEASCRFAKGLGAKKCVVLYNGVDTKFFDGEKKKHKGVNVVFVGRLIQEKGVQDLIKAVKGLNVNLTIVGSGPYEKELKKMAGENVRFVGSKDSKGVKSVLSESDVLVNPSYAEGLPTSVLEAGAMGLAVIATDVGGTKEIIENEKNGFLFNAGNVKLLRKHIQKLVFDASLREKFGSEIKKKIRNNFDWDIIAEKFERVLKKL